MITRIKLLITFVLFSCITTHGYGYKLCSDIERFKILDNTFFEIPKINPVGRSDESPSFSTTNIDQLMCFSKLNLPEKTCFSIYVMKSSIDHYIWGFYGLFHEVLEGEISTTRRIKALPDHLKHGFPLCSMCKFGGNHDFPNTVTLGKIISAGETHNKCINVVGDPDTYSTNFNAKTQYFGLTKKSR